MKDYTKDKNPEKLEPFFPNEMFRHIIVTCFLIIVELAAVIVLPLPWKFINKPDHIPWFLLLVYRLRNLIQNDTLFTVLSILSVLLFILWPFLTERKKRNISPCNGCYRRNDNLWQRPILFSIVVTAIIFVITICLINP